MSRIRLLSEATVNRIAAGEVIERPAAAAKELVENALDAGATRITVCLEGGGIERLEVIDNGIGMSADELALAVLRHATSKLSDETLIQITTLGFRGEALPSIGAAARLHIISRPHNADHANRVTVEGGKVSQVEPTSGPPGTRVVIRDLFFATPARRKFLKNPRTEAEHAETVVRRLALAAPHVAFRMEIDGRMVFEVTAHDRLARVAALIGSEAAAALLPLTGERFTNGSALDDTLGAPQPVSRISGYVCSPAVTRSTPLGQALVVNGRPVADPVLRTAVRVAYRDVIAVGRHPIVALYLDLPPHEVDVNVHPTKAELRFRDPGAIRSLVIGAVRKALGVGSGHAAPTVSAGLGRRQPWVNSAYGLRLSSDFPPRSSPDPLGLAEAQLPLQDSPAARQVTAIMPRPEHPLGAPVAQVLDTYVIAVASDGSLVLVDQHAAHERLTHEAIHAQMMDGGVRAQSLLLPAVVDLPRPDVERLLARRDDLATLGLDLEEFGAGAVLVRALPAVLGSPEPAPLLRDLADELADMGEQTVLSMRLDAIVARLACHGSIRAGRRLTEAEMSALLRRMEATPRAATCSHGRPTVLKLSKAEIEKMFGRR